MSRPRHHALPALLATATMLAATFVGCPDPTAVDAGTDPADAGDRDGDGDGDGDEEVDGGACAGGACSPDGGPVRGDGDDSLELGFGFIEWEPANAGDDAQLVAGWQGGHHVWGSFRVRDLPIGTEVDFLLEMVTADGSVAETGWRMELRESDTLPGVGEMIGTTILLYADAESLDGVSATYRGEVTPTAGGPTLTAELPVTLRCCAGVGGDGDGDGDGSGPDGGPIVGGGMDGPVIRGLVATPSSVIAGQTLDVAVFATTASGASLTYAWSAAQGAFADATADATTWTAPVDEVTTWLTVDVSDGTRTTSASLPVEVFLGP